MNLAHPRAKLRPLRDLVHEARAAGSGEGRRPGRLAGFLDDLEEALLAPRAFTSVLPVEPAADLLERVRILDQDKALLDVPGVQALRFSLRGGALLFSCVHEGEREDVLYELFEACGPALDSVLQHCRDYPGRGMPDACVRMLLDTAVERPAPPGRAPRRELRHLPLMHTYERAIPDEGYWIGRCARLMRAASRRATREARRKDPHSVAHRGVHAKHHGFIRARFVVRDLLPSGLSHGVFQPGRRYDAWLRVSNMSREIKADRAPDARGLAIKLERVNGSDCQDFLLASHPVFIAKDVRDYTVFQSLVGSREPGWVKKLRMGLYLARRPRERRILKSALQLVPKHPLAIDYHSMSAYSLGAFRAVKYLVRPLIPVASSVAPAGDDSLRISLRDSLDPRVGHALRLEFCLVVPPPALLLTVEDGCADWTEQAEIIPVATIEIEPQDPTTPEMLARAERTVFSLENSLPDHDPLGSLNRARKAVYRESANHRSAANRGS